MSTPPNSSSAKPRKSSAARGASPPSDTSPPSLSMPGILDQEQFLSSSSTTASDLAVKEANAVMSASSSLGEDAPEGEQDVQHENGEENGGAAKKPVWSKPSNGPAAKVVGAVMGAESWPALSESARASPKSPSIYPHKALPPGPVTVSQELAVVSLSSPKEVSASSISTPTTPNHTIPSRQRSMKRGGGSGSLNHNMLVNESSQAQGSVDATTSNAGKSSGSVGGESFRDRDNTNKDGGQRGGTHGGNDSHPQRNSFRRSNSGPLAYHANHGRRDHGKQDWGNRSFGRDNHGPQQRVGSRPFLRGPTPNTSLIAPPPPPLVRPLLGPVVYTEMSSPVYYVSPHPDQLRPPMHMVPMQQMFFPMHAPHLQSKIMTQIEYYFSNENLVKDLFLRQNMDAEGWVPIQLIAGFSKVMQLTDNIQLVLEAIKASNVVEVQGDKMRRKSDWMKWIMPSSPQSIARQFQQ